MTLFEKVYNALEPLDIPVVRSFYKGDERQYAIVSIYNEMDFMVFDNQNQAEIYEFKVTYWREANEEDKSKTIKSLMKKAGFRFMYASDLYDEGYFGNALDFQGVLTLDELEEGDK